MTHLAAEPLGDLRQDLAPLRARLHLPDDIRSARWVAINPNLDTGFLPPKIELFKIYAFIDLDANGWSALEQITGRPGQTGQIVVPRDIAAVLLPGDVAALFKTETKDELRATVTLFDTHALPMTDKVHVSQAARLGTALFIEFTTH